MNITQSALNKIQFVLMTIVLFCVAGIIAYFSMPRDENPSYIVRTAQVITFWPGASPERVEQLITDKIEKKIQEMSEIDYIESESKTGVSIITVNILDQYKDLKSIWTKLRDKVEDSKRDLPETAETSIVNDEYGDIFGIVFSIIWDGFTYASVKDIAEDVRDDILDIKDVAKVDIFGTQDERIFVDFNNDKLREVGISSEQLGKMLSERNIIKSGGIIYTKKDQIAIEPTGNYEDIEDIRETLIQLPKSNKIMKLEDITEVYRGYIDPPKALMRTNDQPSIGIAVAMREGGNILNLGKNITSLIDNYKQEYPIGIEFEMVAFQPERVIKKISEFVSNLIQAIIIVCIVMLLFLGLKTGFIVASLIPTAILITIAIMAGMNIWLNQVTLASLIIALGMLVDNAIVMSENIIVQIKNGKKPLEAAIYSSKELKIPLLISSLTTSAAFLPFYLAESGTGEYIGSLFLVVTITLLSSFFISLTMIPMFCIYLLKNQEKKEKKILFFFKRKNTQKEKFSDKIYKFYKKNLLCLLKHRTVTISCIILVFILSLYINTFVPKIFYPPSDTPMFTAEIEMPVGSSIWRTKDVIEKIEDFISESTFMSKDNSEGIINWSTYIGNGGPRFRLQHDPEPANPHYAYMLFNTTNYDIIAPIINKLDKFIFNNFPDAKAKIRPLQEGTPVTNPIEVRIRGKDINTLFSLSDQVKTKLESISGVKYIDDDWGQKIKKIAIKVDDTRAKRANITNADVALSIESALSGITLTEFREEDELIPIVLRSEAARDIDLIATEAYNVYSQKTGKSVPLLQVADIKIEWESAIIFRRNRIKTITVFSDLQNGFTANQINKQLIPWLKEQTKNWPIGYHFAIGGEKEEAEDAQNSIFVKLPIAGLIILLLLMIQFNCIRKTLIILMTIPMSIIGVILGLLITDSYFGIMTILGLISLAGIVINNAIVLLDRIKIEIQENNLTQQQAIITASQKRMRPILLTTITTISSLIPLWIGGGLLWEPMAIAIIFGLLLATILTLGIVPVLYAILFRVNYKNFEEQNNENMSSS